MSHNLTLSKYVKAERKGQKPRTDHMPVRQTPTELTRRCGPFIDDRWRVFDGPTAPGSKPARSGTPAVTQRFRSIWMRFGLP